MPSSRSAHRLEATLFLCILLVQLLHGAALIYRTSFVSDGTRYFVLADDEMISMRYARNLVRGDGPVWNPGGERVEGFSNPLWVLLMAGVHLLGFSAAKAGLAVQVIGVLLLALNLIVLRRLARAVAPGLPAAGLLAALFAALYFPLNLYTALGFEVSLVALILSTSALLAVNALKVERFPTGAFILLGAGTWVRLDVAVAFMALLAVILVLDPPRRRRTLGTAAAILLAFLGTQTACRLLYYGQWFPNPYYLKMTGYPVFLRIARGALVLWDFVWRSNMVLFLLAFLYPLYKKDRLLALLAALPAGQMLYSVYAGGDSWEFWGLGNRFVLVGMPLLFLLLGVMAAEVLSKCSARWPEAGRLRGWAAAALAALLLFNLNSPYAVASAGEWLSLKPILDMPSNKRQLEAGRFIQSITRPGAVVAVAWGGIVPYFTDLPCVDLTGKNDPDIARLPMRTFDQNPSLFPYNNLTRSRYTFFYPGHLKWDYAHSLGRLAPDVILQLWGEPKEAEPFLKSYSRVPYVDGTLYARTGSDRVLWERVAAEEK